MSCRLIKVDTENLHLAWNDAVCYLENALFQTPEYTLLDIYRLIKERALTLWMFYNDKKKTACGAMATEIIEHPRKRVLSIFLLGADDFKQIEPLFAQVLLYAKHVKADEVECAGRMGLEKLLSDIGFKKSYIVMNYTVN